MIVIWDNGEPSAEHEIVFIEAPTFLLDPSDVCAAVRFAQASYGNPKAEILGIADTVDWFVKDTRDLSDFCSPGLFIDCIGSTHQNDKAARPVDGSEPMREHAVAPAVMRYLLAGWRAKAEAEYPVLTEIEKRWCKMIEASLRQQKTPGRG